MIQDIWPELEKYYYLNLKVIGNKWNVDLTVEPH